MCICSTEKRNWFAILGYLLYLVLLFIVQNKGNSGLKECALKVQYTVCLTCPVGYCLSCRPQHPRSLILYPLDLKPSCARIARKTSWFFFVSTDFKRNQWQQGQTQLTVEDSGKTRLVDYTSELLYFLLVMLLSGPLQFDINFALTGK